MNLYPWPEFVPSGVYQRFAPWYRK